MKLAVCAIAYNEGRHLAEWLAFHHLAGFDACIVGDNGSTDNTRTVIAQRARAQNVQVVAWPHTGPDTQTDFYLAVCRLYGREYDWMLFIDIDEFLNTRGITVREYLTRVGSDSSSLAIPWRVFAGPRLIPPDGLTVESYTACLPWRGHNHTKAFVRPHAVVAWLNPHAAAVRGEARGSRGEHVKFALPGVFWPGDRAEPWAYVHHYFYRSRAEWMDKLNRGRVSRAREVRTVENWEKGQADATDTNEDLVAWAPGVRAELLRNAQA